MPSAPDLLAISAAFCWGTSDFVSYQYSRRVGFYRTQVYLNLVSMIMLLALVPVLSLNTTVTPFLLGVLAIVSVFSFFGGLLVYKAFQDGVISMVAPVTYTYPVITAVLAVFFLHDALSPPEVMAVAAVILGAVLFSARFSELRKDSRERRFFAKTPAMWAAVGAAAILGSAFYGIGYLVRQLGYMLPIIAMKGFIVLYGFMLAPALGQTVMPIKEGWKVIMAMSVLETVGILSFGVSVFYASQSLPIVTALSGMGGAFAVLYALIFLRERIEPNQVIGLVLAFLGVWSLLYLTA